MIRYLSIAILVAACGGHHGDGSDDDAGASGSSADAAPFTGTCTPGGPACSNCIDDDGDGLIDGFDPECTGPFDNDEATFATGIPGDNKDAINQDCFFDGDSGGGNDGCNQHVCCLLGATTKAECQADLVGIVNNPDVEGNKYDVAKCFVPLGMMMVPPKCKMTCAAITPPGCDCFGCCTICDPGSNQCYDIAINPATSPECTTATLSDPTKCLRCTKATDCSTPCGGTTCVLCPGQDPGDLDPSCTGATCPVGETACPGGSGCPDETYCSTGCCIGVVQ